MRQAARRKPAPEPARITGRMISIRQQGGFGFILADESNTQYFVHIREVEPSAWALNVRVSFVPGEQTDPNKSPRASEVRLALEGES